MVPLAGSIKPMASQHLVRQYLAYWFQLGKKVILRNGQDSFLPQPVIAGDRYSDPFEACWKDIMSQGGTDAYLEGTNQTIAELLTPAWELNPCARCSMPVPVASLGLPSLTCPCSDLPFWPDTQAPQPRSPVSSQAQLVQIRDRLLSLSQRPESQAS